MPSALTKLSSTPDLVDRVYGSLLGAISSGALAPGQRIKQEEVAAQLAVSRQPVLQAIRQLKNDGLLQDAPGRGVQVAPLDVGWMAKVYQVRGALDGLAARLAAAKRAQIDPGLVAQGRKVARGRSVEAMIDADMAFHQAIYNASGNPLIGQIAAQNWRHLHRMMGAVLRVSDQRVVVWDEHEAIAAAIAAGQGRTATTLVERHSDRASAHLRSHMSQAMAREQTSAPP